jgi:hypothetical protein
VSQEPHVYLRRGPFLALSAHTWVDVRRIAVVSETNPPGGPTRVVIDTADRHCLTVYRPLAEVVEALGEASRDWARERAQEEEVGRLMTLDAERMPPGELPVAGWDVPEHPFP